MQRTTKIRKAIHKVMTMPNCYKNPDMILSGLTELLMEEENKYKNNLTSNS